MQPWIYAQSPRLRLTDSQCPDVTKRTFSNCFIERRANATHGAGAGAGAGAGGAHEEKLCSYSTRSLLGGERAPVAAGLQRGGEGPWASRCCCGLPFFPALHC